MSWQIKQNKNKDKFKIWSTITDSYIVDTYLTRDEMIDFLSKEELRNAANKIKNLKDTFPNGWTDKDGRLIIIN